MNATRSKRIYFRASEAERQAIQAAAKEKKLPISRYVRLLHEQATAHPIDRALLQSASRKACANLLALQTQLAPSCDDAQTLFLETFALLQQIQQEVNRA